MRWKIETRRLWGGAERGQASCVTRTGFQSQAPHVVQSVLQMYTSALNTVQDTFSLHPQQCLQRGYLNPRWLVLFIYFLCVLLVHFFSTIFFVFFLILSFGKVVDGENIFFRILAIADTFFQTGSTHKCSESNNNSLWTAMAMYS